MINGQEIYLTRGDTAELKFPAFVDKEDGTEEPYEFQPEDEVWFRLAQKAGQKPILIEEQCYIDYENNVPVLYLTEDSTKNLKFGIYRYEVELRAGSERYTYIEDQPFKIGNEVEEHER